MNIYSRYISIQHCHKVSTKIFTDCWRSNFGSEALPCNEGKIVRISVIAETMVLTNSTPIVYSGRWLSGKIPIQRTVPSSGPVSLIHTTRSPFSSGGKGNAAGSELSFEDGAPTEWYISGHSSDNWRRWFWNWSRSEIWFTAAKTPHRSSQSK